METPKDPPLAKYTAKQISEITDRIVVLRKRWLSSVATQIRSGQKKTKTPVRPTQQSKT
jgi:hypothetical protein